MRGPAGALESRSAGWEARLLANALARLMQEEATYEIYLGRVSMPFVRNGQS